MEARTTGPVHELLLRLAGRIDDDLMAQVRELVAVREDGRALELLTAAMAADATVLPVDVRAWLVTAARASRTDLDADSALAPAGDDDDEHRFSAEAPPGSDAVIAAVRALPARWLEGCDVRLTWRLTPAGTAPGPLPHPVLLVRTAADGPGQDDVIAYQLAAVLDRSVAPVSVEVVAADHAPSAYHAAAWRSAVVVRDSDDGGTPVDGTASRRAAGLLGGATAPAGVSDDVDARAPVSHRAVRKETERPAEPVSNGRSASDQPHGHAEPAVISIPEQPTGPGAETAVPSTVGTRSGPADAPARSLPDPGPRAADGPPDAPAPLPMRAPGGRRRLVEQSGPQRPVTAPLPRPAPPRSPHPGPVPFVRRNRPSPRPQPAAPTPSVDPPGSIPRPSRREPDVWLAAAADDTARHDPLLAPIRRPLLDPLLDPTFRQDVGAGRQQDRSVGADPTAEAGPDPADGGSPSGGGSQSGGGSRLDIGSLADIGLKPESLARLSDADRALLARLQAELVAGRRSPGTDRNTTNGTARTDPTPSA